MPSAGKPATSWYSRSSRFSTRPISSSERTPGNRGSRYAAEASSRKYPPSLNGSLPGANVLSRLAPT